LAYELTVELLSRHADLTGLYVAGGGMEGVIQALRDNGAGGQVRLLRNELAPTARMDLVVELMAKPLTEPGSEPARLFLPFEMYTSENV